MPEPADTITVEVVYALPERQDCRRIEVRPPCSAGQAVRLAGLEPVWSPGEDQRLALACFGRPINADALLGDGDRVEILRPLQADPKDQRRQRADTARRARRREAQARG